MDQKKNKRKASSPSIGKVEGKTKRRKIDGKEKTVDLVRKLLDTLSDEKKREQSIRQLAKMIEGNNRKDNLRKLAGMYVERNNQKNKLSKLAGMVKNNRRTRGSYVIEDRDIRELARIVKSRSNMNIPKTVFNIDLLRTHVRFGYNEYIYNVDIGSEHLHTLPDFYNNLRTVFEYLLNCMHYYAETNTDKARFYISNAPRTAFSTAILSVSDFTTDMFFDIFERHMQSNAQEVINNGKSNAESGRGKKNEVATKHGREVRHGVFQIGKGNVTNTCLALSLLVGISHLHSGEKMSKLQRNRNTTLTELYDDDDIKKVYAESGLNVGAVRVDQLHLVYTGYLKPQGVDLVVFSKAKDDTVVYDSRLDDSGVVARITKQIIYLWLNDSHYDLILDPNVFSRCSRDHRCDISIEPVECCGYRQYVFEKNNADIVEDLMNFIMEQPKGSVWIAHNGGRFDSIFLMNELLVKRRIVPRVIMNGNKIMCIELEERNLKIIDSFLFVSMRLSMFPKALGIKDITKGFHPYLFTDLNYVGPMIGLEYFELPPKGSEERGKFDKWYEEQKNKTYVFREAIYYYCRLDVDIMRQGCIIFARLINKVTGVLPFYDSTCHTVAGLALKIYRSNYLQKNTIGQIPANGYGGVKVNQSAIALCWLREIEEELRGCDFILDSRLSTNTIYQFHGCFYHGCKKRYDADTYNAILNERFFVLRSRTVRLTTLFRQHGYKVIEKWECDYKEEREITDNYLDRIRLTDFFIYLDLNPRDALFGGRTSPAVLYYDCNRGEKKKDIL
ncbi:DNA polymerase [Paramuricea clavata]|uniref:DNA-directed DNA polymerase n=1 Tax=Paramuricea clavata TaxID=317549 RepID=A0A7D9DP45_PARCT|nr:DNA polymerase [Paramuricea clavata]